MSPALIEVRHVSKSYRRGGQVVPVLHDLSFDVLRGDFLGLMGPSGSGKSTLLNLLAGIDQPDAGEILVDGVDITGLPESDLADWRAAAVGFVFQFYNLMPVLTALENVELPLLLTSLSSAERKKRAQTALRVRLEGGRALGDLVQAEGLTPGERVVVKPADKLADGARVK